MSDDYRKNSDFLETLVSADTIYSAWERSFLDAQKDFVIFANTQPENIRNMLFAYADGGRMMLQRKINIACRYMYFPNKESGG